MKKVVLLRSKTTARISVDIFSFSEMHVYIYREKNNKEEKKIINEEIEIATRKCKYLKKNKKLYNFKK